MSFEDKCLVKGVLHPHNDSLVNQMHIANYDTEKVYVDNGSTVNLIYNNLFECLKFLQGGPPALQNFFEGLQLQQIYTARVSPSPNQVEVLPNILVLFSSTRKRHTMLYLGDSTHLGQWTPPTSKKSGSQQRTKL